MNYNGILETMMIQKGVILTHPQALDGFNYKSKDENNDPKMKTLEGKGVGVCSLARNTSGVEGHAEASGWGLGRLKSKSIIHMDLHKPNNKLVNAKLKHFWCMNEPRQTWIHKTHHGLDLGEATTFPLIVIFVPGHMAITQMSFCSEIPKIGTLATLEAHNFVWKPPIEVRFKAKL
jgi:hypothetical protein